MLPSGSCCAVGSRHFQHFAAQSHGLLARCLRFAPSVARGHARLASDFGASWSGGTSTRWVTSPGFRNVWTTSASSGSRLLWTHSTEWGEAAGEARWEGASHPQGFTERYTYEVTGEVKTVKDRLARTTTMAHDQLGRLLAMVDAAGRRHGRSYSVPTASGWQGPTLTAAGADGTIASTTLSTPLRDGDYQLGVNGLQTAGFPAQSSLYSEDQAPEPFPAY